VLQDVCSSAVHFGAILPALFVMKWPSVPDRGQDQTVADAAAVSRFRDSQVIAPMVPGINRKR